MENIILGVVTLAVGFVSGMYVSSQIEKDINNRTK
tara:strand:+ start:322 stop:426 length:105 start_codon:yes stop_codon:yes gene_type:complete